MSAEPMPDAIVDARKTERNARIIDAAEALAQVATDLEHDANPHNLHDLRGDLAGDVPVKGRLVLALKAARLRYDEARRG